MTIDKSLKRKGRLARSRNVLTRGERLLQMKGEDLWKEGSPVLGLAKTRVIKIASGKKKKKKEPEAADAKKGGGKKK